MRKCRPAEREGFEPSVILLPHRFSRPDLDSPKDQPTQEIRGRAQSEVPTVVPSRPNALSPSHLAPELNKIVDAWSSLPPIVKAGILAMIEAAKGGQKATRRATEPGETGNSVICVTPSSMSAT